MGANLNATSVPFNMANMYEVRNTGWGFHFNAFSNLYAKDSVANLSGNLNLTATMGNATNNVSATIDSSNRWLNF